MPTILLLIMSNIFMTFAWYGHLKYKESPLWIVILASWGIAFFEYCLQVPANRIGHRPGDSWRFVTKSRRHVVRLARGGVREGGVLYWSTLTD